MNKRKLSKETRLVWGYTTLEILVVISVTTMLTGIMILYSRTSENQIALIKEQAKVVNAFVRAKALARETFAEEGDLKPCAYGLYRDKTTDVPRFIIFRDLPDSETPKDCGLDSADRIYTDETELFDSFSLDEHISIGSETTFEEVIFIPPDPTTILNRDPESDDDKVLVLETRDGSWSYEIKINSAGQITSKSK